MDSSTVVPIKFPFLDLRAQFDSIHDEVMNAVTRVIDSQHFILGAEVERFEQEIAEYLGVEHAVGCASGSDALVLALMALGIGYGDEVITTPYTFGATAGSIARVGALPVFVDIDPATYNIDAAKVEAAVSPRTKAILPVHLFGLIADMDPLMRIATAHGLTVIEDAAQAIGASYNGVGAGNFGSFGCFSFFPSKNLGGAGDGGLVTTRDAAMARRLKALRAHGCYSKYRYDMIGLNSRLDALQAAILRVKLHHLSLWTASRQTNAARYEALFTTAGINGPVGLPIAPSGSKHVFNQFVIRVRNRDALRENLRQAGVPTEIYYPEPLHTQPAFAYLGRGEGAFPHAETASQETVGLPIFPELTVTQQETVVQSIKNFLDSGATDLHPSIAA